jgi:hypothetical protein
MRNRVIFCFIILSTLFLSISAISASENLTCDNLTSIDEDFDEPLSLDNGLNEVSSTDDVVIADEANKSSTEISANDKTSYVDYKDTFVVKLTSGGVALAEKPVRITLNNVEYDKVTDSNGQASVDFKLKTGTYVVSYSFDGDDNCTASNGSSTLTVKSDIKTSIKLIDKSKKVHCEGVKSVFKIKLVDVYGKALSGKKVKIKIRGKTYSAKTNKNGVAKFYVNLKKGNNKVKYYFSKKGKYLASSGTYNVKVKSKLSKGNGYWVNRWDMKNVNLKKLSKRGTKHIFLLHTVFDMYGKKEVLKWIKKAHKHRMKVHMWICAFYSDGHYITPCSKNGHFNYKQMNKVIKKSKYYASFKEVDGIHFDYTRFPGTAHKYKNGVKAVNYFIETASNALRDVKPGIIVSSAVMPEPNDMKYYYAQDISTMSKHLDVLVPMVYKGNYHAGDNWIKKTTKAFVKKSKGAQIWAGLQSYRSDSNIKKLSYKELFKDAKYAKKGGASGIVIFRWGLSALLNFKKL